MSAASTARVSTPPVVGTGGDRRLPPIVAEIIARNAVRDGDEWVQLHSHLSPDDGFFLQELIEASRATRSLEVGLAYGISTLFLCEALLRNGSDVRHVAIDPFQSTDWRNIGRQNAARAGFDELIEFYQERSEFVLPRLAQDGRTFDFALIDGWHSFEQALVEFFYIDRMLRIGGIVAFDDADWPGISKLMRFLITRPDYEVYRQADRSIAPSMIGRLRQRVADSRIGQSVLHPSVRRRPWELGIHPRCVALRKIADDKREMRFFVDF